MPELIRTKCPNCKHDLRIPADWINQAVRCKHCRTVVNVKHKAALAKPPAKSAPPREPRNGSSGTPAEHPEEALNFATTDDAPIVRVDRRYRSRRSQWIALAVFTFLIVIGAGAVYMFWGPLRQIGTSLRDNFTQDESKPKDTVPAAAEHTPAEFVFPRRALAICVNNYLYANPVAYGTEENDVGTFLDKLSKVLHIDPSQVIELSDAAKVRQPKQAAGKKGKSPPGAGKTNTAAAPDSPARPPLKPVIEKTVQDFLDGSRAQDRIILLFAGHVVEVDDEAFLVPLEGELGVKDSLIPVSWIFEQMKICRARQKVLILDTCRIDPGHGLERPGSGPMGDKLEAMLAKPPEGIQVWTACVKGQYSYEVDAGSLFLREFTDALDPKVIKKIQHAEEPLPLEALAGVVNKKVEGAVAAQLKEKQTPRLAGVEVAGGAAYDKAEALPAKFMVPRPAPPRGGIAKLAEVKSILDEIELPPIKVAREENARLQIESLVPFSAKKLAEYQADYSSVKEIDSNADKFPLRVAVLKTVSLMRDKFDPKNADMSLRENFGGSTNDKVKAEILKDQARPAELLADLMEAKDALMKAGENRDKEPSKRWQAHYDFALAQVLARIAYVEEYSLALGKIRKGELAELEQGQTGYRLASREKLQGTKEFKDIAAESKKLLKKVARDHKGTPWEILAKREQLTALGLQWQVTR